MGHLDWKWLHATRDAGDVEALARRLIVDGEDLSQSERIAVIMTLGRTGRREACEPLGKVMADGDRTLRATAARALGLIEDPESVAILKAATTDPKRNVRMWALRSLGAAGKADVTDLLGQWVRTGRTWERYYAIEGLGLTGAEAAVPHLAVALEERKGRLRWAAARALVELGLPSGIEPLLAAAKRESLIGRRLMRQAFHDLVTKADGADGAYRT